MRDVLHVLHQHVHLGHVAVVQALLEGRGQRGGRRHAVKKRTWVFVVT